MKLKIFNDKNSSDRIWAVRVVEPGDRYGLDWGLQLEDSSDSLVEFYDCRYEHTEYGQFVTRYYLKTILDRTPGCGLRLDGGISEWYISLFGMNRIVAWLKEVC